MQCKTTIQLLQGKRTIGSSVNRVQCNRLRIYVPSDTNLKHVKQQGIDDGIT